MDIDQLKTFRDRFNLPLTDEQVENLEFYHPGEKSEEVKYLKQKRSTQAVICQLGMIVKLN